MRELDAAKSAIATWNRLGKSLEDLRAHLELAEEMKDDAEEKEVSSGIEKLRAGAFILIAADGTRCVLDKHGDPDFSPFLNHPSGVKKVEIAKFETRPKDFRAANEAARTQNSKFTHSGDTSPEDYTWHHMRDMTTMQLVPHKIHSLFTHEGGFAHRD